MLSHAAALRPGLLLALVLALPACSDGPTAPPASAPALPVAQLTCTVQVRAGTMTCSDAGLAASASGVRGNVITVGGQHHFVRLLSTGTTFTAIPDLMTTTVTVQNLLAVALGTPDGTTPDATGVRVFFPADPTNGVEVENPTGYGAFTAPNQPYFQYGGSAGSELGPDGVLVPGEVSTGKEWHFKIHGAPSFTFTVYVQAQAANGTYPAQIALIQIVAGGGYTCGLTGGGQAYCWGQNFNNQLGDGTDTTRHTPVRVAQPAGVTFVSLATHASHTCALTAAGQAYCWGTNFHGELGDGTTTQRSTPVPVAQPAGITFASLAASVDRTCALTSGGQTYCWGYNAEGEVGDGSTTDRVTPVAVAQPAGVSFASVATGAFHTCGVTSAGQAYCWGYNGEGELGDGTTTNRATPVPVAQPAGVGFASMAGGTFDTCGLTSAGQAYCWGINLHGQLGDGTKVAHPTPAPVVQPAGVSFTFIAAGDTHVCGVTAAQQAYCWGEGTSGELGIGLFDIERTTPVAVQQPPGVSFSSLTLGGCTCGISSGGPAYCWGANGAWQVGDGTQQRQYVPVVVAGTI